MSNADGSQPERLFYSGITNASSDDRTSATDSAGHPESPTGKESVVATEVFGTDADNDDVDIIHRLQPGVDAADTVGREWRKKSGEA